MIYLSNWIRIRSRIKTWEIGPRRLWNSRCLHLKTSNKILKIKRRFYKNKFLLASYLIAFNHFRNKSLAWISSSSHGTKSSKGNRLLLQAEAMFNLKSQDWPFLLGLLQLHKLKSMASTHRFLSLHFITKKEVNLQVIESLLPLLDLLIWTSSETGPR